MTAKEVVWTAEAERDLLAMPPEDAHDVLNAVEVFAATGRGFLRVLLDGSGQRRLYLPRYSAFIEFDGVKFTVVRVSPRA